MMLAFLSSPVTLIVWLVIVAICVAWTVRDLWTKNAHLMPLMKMVWILTVTYSGPLGLAIYRYAGRKEIAEDNLWRRSFRSVAHCYSGCGMGEIIGVLVASGIFALHGFWVSLITFVLAYVIGFGLTVGPLMQDGVSFRRAVKDALVAETTSITVMEVVAITVALVLTRGVTMGHPLFWMGLAVSLTCGLIAAYPVNVLLIRHGIKEGMMDPRMTDHGDHGDHAEDGHDHQGHHAHG